MEALVKGGRKPVVSEPLLDPNRDLGVYSWSWGCASECENNHRDPGPGGITGIDRVYCAVLGRDKAPWPAASFIAQAFKSCDIRWPSMASWPRFCDAVGITEEQLKAGRYHVKIPGYAKAMPITDKMEFGNALVYLEHQLRNNNQLSCLTIPPVLLVATGQQATKYNSDDWHGAFHWETGMLAEYESAGAHHHRDGMIADDGEPEA